MDQQIKHHTFVFERQCDADRERVFSAMSDPAQRASWSAPSEDAAFFYDAADFREGGQDAFRCGSKDDPQYTGTATYISIVPNTRIVWVEVVKSGGQTLAALLITTLLEDRDGGTKVQMTVQVTSFCGDAMIRGTETGNNASLDNLVKLVSR
ncbi:SRPBCC domain-containing protein [Agrobacterium cavarae]|uniref:SRPBCC domain-containing protein n=1 Tax=Agrobacterium cavarae TaxID=2528239 RepID=UPI003FD2A6DD